MSYMDISVHDFYSKEHGSYSQQLSWRGSSYFPQTRSYQPRNLQQGFFMPLNAGDVNKLGKNHPVMIHCLLMYINVRLISYNSTSLQPPDWGSRNASHCSLEDCNDVMQRRRTAKRNTRRGALLPRVTCLQMYFKHRSV